MNNNTQSAGLVSESDLTGSTNGKTLSLPGIKSRISYKDEDVETLFGYKTTTLNGDAAAMLPIVDKNGDVPGAANPYGQIVTGKCFRGPDMDAEALDTRDLARVTARTQRKLDDSETEKELKDMAASVAPPETPIEIVEPSAAAITMAGLMQEAGYEEPSSPTFPGIAAVSNPEPICAAKTPMVTVTIDTPMGDFEGRYLDCIVTDEAVILVTDLDANLFTPKSSATILTLVTPEGSLKVCYVGIKFEHDGKRYQLYVREQ